MQYFFQGLPLQSGLGEISDDELISSKEVRELIQCYDKLPARVRVKLLDLAKALSDETVVEEETAPPAHQER